MKHLKVLARARWEKVDCFDTRYRTIYTVSVLKPSFEYPVACVSWSEVKGNYRIFDRFMALEDIQQFHVIPEEYLERLHLAYGEALRQAEAIRKQQSVYHEVAKLQPGTKLVRTDTGEIIADVERFLKEG